jgi:hypothetical protein
LSFSLPLSPSSSHSQRRSFLPVSQQANDSSRPWPLLGLLGLCVGNPLYLLFYHFAYADSNSNTDVVHQNPASSPVSSSVLPLVFPAASRRRRRSASPLPTSLAPPASSASPVSPVPLLRMPFKLSVWLCVHCRCRVVTLLVLRVTRLVMRWLRVLCPICRGRQCADVTVTCHFIIYHVKGKTLFIKESTRKNWVLLGAFNTLLSCFSTIGLSLFGSSSSFRASDGVSNSLRLRLTRLIFTPCQAYSSMYGASSLSLDILLPWPTLTRIT